MVDGSTVFLNLDEDEILEQEIEEQEDDQSDGEEE